MTAILASRKSKLRIASDNADPVNLAPSRQTRTQSGSLGRLAGEAFCAITGLRMEGAYVAKEPPESEEPIPFEEEDLEADLVAGPKKGGGFNTPPAPLMQPPLVASPVPVKDAG